MSWGDSHKEIGRSRKDHQKILRRLSEVEKRLRKLYPALETSTNEGRSVAMGKEIHKLKNEREKLIKRRRNEGNSRAEILKRRI